MTVAHFVERAEARAILFGAGEYADADEAIAPLLDAAFDAGLLDRLGEAAIMQIIDTAFAPFWEPQ